MMLFVCFINIDVLVVDQAVELFFFFFFARFWKVHMMAARSGGQVELYHDLMTAGTVAVKHLPRSRLRDSPQAYQEAWPGEVENPWKEIEIMKLGHGWRQRISFIPNADNT